MRLCLLGKDIFDITADVLVSTVHSSKNLKTGSLSNLVLQKGGCKVQDQLNDVNAGGYLKEGVVIPLEPGNLSHEFKHLILACLYPKKENNSLEIREVVAKCCLQAFCNGFKSIVFPCLGTGGLGFSEEESAQAMMEGVALFAFESAESSLETVYISLYNKSPVCITQWDQTLMKMVQEYNEFTKIIPAGHSVLSYTAVSGTGEQGRRPRRGPSRRQTTQTASLPPYTAHNASKVTPKESSSSSACTSSSRLHKVPLPSFGTKLGPVGIIVTPSLGAGLADDGSVEGEASLKVKLEIPWLKSVFGKIFEGFGN